VAPAASAPGAAGATTSGVAHPVPDQAVTAARAGASTQMFASTAPPAGQVLHGGGAAPVSATPPVTRLGSGLDASLPSGPPAGAGAAPAHLDGGGAASPAAGSPMSPMSMGGGGGQPSQDSRRDPADLMGADQGVWGSSEWTPVVGRRERPAALSEEAPDETVLPDTAPPPWSGLGRNDERRS
jgi:hypothetical protein